MMIVRTASLWIVVLLATCAVAQADEVDGPDTAPPAFASAPADGTDPALDDGVIHEDPMPLKPVVRPECGLCCGQVYDECGWALDRCLKPYGRRELRIEGAATLLDGPEGVVGPDAAVANQLTWDELESDLGLGGRLTFQYAATARDRILVSGAYYGSWDDESRQTGVFGFRTSPLGAVSTSLVNTTTLTSETDLYGGEVHWWREICASQCLRWDLGVGARMLRLEDTATLDAWGQPFPGFAGTPFIGSEATNTFLGVQLGGAVHFDVDRSWTVSASAKALLGSLQREVSVEDRSIFIGGAHTASDDEDVFSWGLDVELGVRRRLSRSLILSASYNLLYLTDVVRAHDALDFNQGATGAVQARQEEDDLLVHAFFLGVTLNF